MGPDAVASEVIAGETPRDVNNGVALSERDENNDDETKRALGRERKDRCNLTSTKKAAQPNERPMLKEVTAKSFVWDTLPM